MSSHFAPLCFVLMPFGKKSDAAGLMIDFDAVYAEIIRPAVVDTGLEPIRADEEVTGGIIHKPMFERLLLCPFAVADLTSANANVFYELGVRHAARPASTVLLFAEGGRLPFDVAGLRALPYRLRPDGGPDGAAAARKEVASRLAEARQAASAHDVPFADSPIYQLVDGFPDIQRLKTDSFRDRVAYAKQQQEQLASARHVGVDSLIAFESDLDANLDAIESGVLVDLLLSYRAVKAWPRMIDLAARMPKPLRQSILVQEQLALALNRAGRDEEAERVLTALVAERGPSSESYALLGRVYKDRWARAPKSNKFLRAGLLKKAAETYLKGFDTDWRDAYPGVNAVTLMELASPPDPRRTEILPVVTYAVKRRVAAGKPDYWDYATLLELAVIAKDETQGQNALLSALASGPETWQAQTTMNNLNLIQEARQDRGEDQPAWIAGAMSALSEAAVA